LAEFGLTKLLKKEEALLRELSIKFFVAISSTTLIGDSSECSSLPAGSSDIFLLLFGIFLNLFIELQTVFLNFKMLLVF